MKSHYSVRHLVSVGLLLTLIGLALVSVTPALAQGVTVPMEAKEKIADEEAQTFTLAAYTSPWVIKIQPKEGQITTRTPEFKWYNISGVDYWTIWIYNFQTGASYRRNFTGICSGGVCRVQPVNLTVGTYSWCVGGYDYAVRDYITTCENTSFKVR